MLQQKVTVHYLDGTTEDVVLTQWSVSQFGVWAARQGIKVDMRDPGPLAVTMLRFQAFAETFRDPQKPRVAFDKWDATVLEVGSDDEQEDVDPTLPGTLEGSSAP